MGTKQMTLELGASLRARKKSKGCATIGPEVQKNANNMNARSGGALTA
jgi:hypothetical protein